MSRLATRFLEHWRASGYPGEGSRVAVACSGGLDSVALLHLLCFATADLGLDLSAAHFDHRMRSGSTGDAAWVRGLAGAWGLALHEGAATAPIEGEASAREARYAFLEGLIETGAVDIVLTAHHADDQVETVLFRLARGAGLDGLRGIRAWRDPGILRPFLPYSRPEIAAYATMVGLRPRMDPTNRSLRYSRNRLRHRAIPELEIVHPGARQGVLRVARIAERTSGALRALIGAELDTLCLTRSGSHVVLSRDGLLSHPESVRAEIVRAAARSLGVTLSESATNSALSFVSEGASGGGLGLRGLRLERSFDRIRLRTAAPSDAAVEGRIAAASVPNRIDIDGPAAGEARVRLGTALWEVRWRPVRADRPESSQAGTSGTDQTEREDSTTWLSWAFAEASVPFPLSLRAWKPGDRVRTRGGKRKVRRLFAEAKIPREARSSVPLLVGADGVVIWVAAPLIPEAEARGPDPSWRVGVRTLEDSGLCWGS